MTIQPSPGALCVLKRRGTPVIHARRVPEMVGSPRDRPNRIGSPEEQIARVFICEIPDGTQVLYLSTQCDAFSTLMRGRSRSPHAPWARAFHCVLWNDRPVWICGDEATLEEVPGAGAG